jgi:hypothetical protein
MSAPIIRAKKYHGVSELGMSRYLALYIAQLGWLLLGEYFLRHAYWPSTCRPHTLFETYVCSLRLPESRHFIEAATFTWLWTTPILILLEVSRRYRAWAYQRMH